MVRGSRQATDGALCVATSTCCELIGENESDECRTFIVESNEHSNASCSSIQGICSGMNGHKRHRIDRNILRPGFISPENWPAKRSGDGFICVRIESVSAFSPASGFCLRCYNTFYIILFACTKLMTTLNVSCLVRSTFSKSISYSIEDGSHHIGNRTINHGLNARFSCVFVISIYEATAGCEPCFVFGFFGCEPKSK